MRLLIALLVLFCAIVSAEETIEISGYGSPSYTAVKKFTTYLLQKDSKACIKIMKTETIVQLEKGTKVHVMERMKYFVLVRKTGELEEYWIPVLMLKGKENGRNH